MFALVRIAPNSWALDFDSKQQEELIVAHGGSLVSLKLIDALRADAASEDRRQKRKCYVVCWGGFTEQHLDIHPILSQLKRQGLCELVKVTPLWLHTCVSVQKRVQPSRIPLLFQPQLWQLRRLVESNESDKIKADKIQISISGFSGTERAAIILLLCFIGATYHDDMTNKNTHLICKDRSGGEKFQKATKWGFHVVSIDWLYHILQYGYSGKTGTEGIGCETRFNLVD
jgi:hypothetical protein